MYQVYLQWLNEMLSKEMKKKNRTQTSSKTVILSGFDDDRYDNISPRLTYC